MSVAPVQFLLLVFVSLTRPAVATLPFVTAARDYLPDKLNDDATAKRRSKAYARALSSRRARTS